MKSEAKVCRNFAGILPELNGNLPNFAKIQNPAVTADKLQPTPDHMTNAALLASSSARPLPRPLSANLKQKTLDHITKGSSQVAMSRARLQRSVQPGSNGGDLPDRRPNRADPETASLVRASL